jgi:ribosomal protein S18 acetylase RimI-like enzyme
MNAAVAIPALVFRDATPADVTAIVALVESAYRGDASRAGWTTEADLLDGQRVDPVGVGEIIARRGSRVLLAEASAPGDARGQLVACCHLERHGDACYLGMFSVKPTGQGAGIGKRMLEHADRIARADWNCSRMEMTVISIRNDLIAWYERRGYRRTGRFKPFPYGDERFGIPKRDDLRFELLEKPLDMGRGT